MVNSAEYVREGKLVEPLFDRVKQLVTKREIIIGVATTVALSTLIGLGAHFGFLPNMPWQDFLIAMGGAAVLILPMGASAMLRLRHKPLEESEAEPERKGGLQYHNRTTALFSRELEQYSAKTKEELVRRIVEKQYSLYTVSIEKKGEVGEGFVKVEKMVWPQVDGSLRVQDNEVWVGTITSNYEVKLEVPKNPRINMADVNSVGYIHVTLVTREPEGKQAVHLHGLTEHPPQLA